MTEDILKGKWMQLRGKVKQQWGRLTDDELDNISGRKDELIGILQEKYGYGKERAEREVNEFLESNRESM